MTQDASRIGNRIRAARKAAGLTQRKLAARLGVAQSRVSTWENGYGHLPSAPEREALAAALDIEPDFLVAEIVVVDDVVPPPMYYRVHEVAARLNVSRSLVYKLIANGSIDSISLGRRRLVPIESIEGKTLEDLAS